MKLTTAAYERVHGRKPGLQVVAFSWYLQACTDAEGENLVGAPLRYTGTLGDAIERARFEFVGCTWVTVLPWPP